MEQIWEFWDNEAEHISNPGDALREHREETEIIYTESEAYLVRDSEVISAFKETEDGYRSIEIEHPIEDFDDRERKYLGRGRLSELVDIPKGSIGGVERRNKKTKFSRSDEIEEELADALGMTNYFEVGHVETASGYSRGSVIYNLQKLAENTDKEYLTMRDIPDEHSGLPRAVEKLFGSWSKAKSAAELNESPHGNRQYHADNKEAFETIEDPETAYWLGMLYADGSVRTKNNSVKLKLQERDKETVKQFQEFLGADNPLKVEERSDSNHSNMVSVSCRYPKLKEDLGRWGVRPRKTHELKWPNETASRPHDLPDEYIPDFVRGLFDGDGSLNVIGKEQLHWSLRGKQPLLEGIKESVIEQVGVEPNIYNSDRTSDKLYIGGNDQVPLIVDWMYENVESSEDPFMERKLRTVMDHPKIYERESHGDNLQKVQNWVDELLDDIQESAKIEA